MFSNKPYGSGNGKWSFCSQACLMALNSDQVGVTKSHHHLTALWSATKFRAAEVKCLAVCHNWQTVSAGSLNNHRRAGAVGAEYKSSLSSRVITHGHAAACQSLGHVSIFYSGCGTSGCLIWG